MALGDDFRNLEKNIRELNAQGVELESTFNDIADSIQKAGKNSTDFGNVISTSAKDTKNLAKKASELAKFSKEDLKNKKQANSYSKKAQELAREQRKVQAEIAYLEEARVNATEAERENIDQALEGLYAASDASREVAEGYQEIVGANNKLNSNTKYLDTLHDTLASIPGLGPLIAGPFKEAGQAMREVAIEGGGFFEQATAGADVLASKFGPAFFLGSLFKANSASTELGRNLGISRERATEMRSEFNLVAINSGKSYLNVENMSKAMSNLASEIGVVAGYTNEQLAATVEMTEIMGLSNAEAAQSVKYGIQNGQTQDEIHAAILDQVVAESKKTGIQLDGRKILSEVLKTNGQLSAIYGYNTEEIARAVVQTQKLGLSLKDAASIADGLLDFESSIANEMEAELMLGKNLNFESARMKALTGDIAGAAQEVADQFGSAEEFSRLNVLQQRSLAQAAGLTVDQLSDAVRERQVLNTLGASNIQQLAEQGRLNDLLTVEGGAQLLQQYKQQSAAEKFQQAVVKIQSAVGAIVEGPLGGLIDGFASLANNAGVVYTTLGLIGAFSLAKTIGQLATMAITMWSGATAAITTASAITFGLGLAAIVGGIAYAMSQAKNTENEVATMNDGVIPPGYGDRIISTKKGSIALNNEDTLVAGTNLMGGEKKPDNSKEMLVLLKQIADKESTVQLDGYRMGTALALV